MQISVVGSVAANAPDGLGTNTTTDVAVLQDKGILPKQVT